MENRVGSASDKNDAPCFGGGGVTSEFILHEFTVRGMSPVCFCDNDVKKQGAEIKGLPVLSVFDAVRIYSDGVFYITTQLYYTQIRNQLLKLGVMPEQIVQYDLICQFTWEKNYREYIECHQTELSEMANCLSDEVSKNVMAARLKFLITRKRKYVCSIRGSVQYFDRKLIDYAGIRAFVDVGLYTGDSVLEFEKYNSMQDCTVYGFELDDVLYRRAQENLKHLGNKVKFYQKAVSDKDGQITIASGLGSMQSIVDIFQECDQRAGVSVEACRLDSVLPKQEDSAFIKMDIEGAELQALRGAESYIRTNRPVLAVCIYHKAEDILEIPRLLWSYYSGYRFYMRHYSDNQTETVLYAIPPSSK